MEPQIVYPNKYQMLSFFSLPFFFYKYADKHIGFILYFIILVHVIQFVG